MVGDMCGGACVAGGMCGREEGIILVHNRNALGSKLSDLKQMNKLSQAVAWYQNQIVEYHYVNASHGDRWGKDA